MMLNIYNDNVINELRTNIKLNMKKYESKEKFAPYFIKDYAAKLYPMNKEVEYPTLNNTVVSKNDNLRQWEIDFNNAVLLSEEFIRKYDISVQIFSDERFIAYLTHDVYWDYMMARWPISDKEGRVKEKYFLPGGNQAFTRNMFLRLFWYPFITYDEKSNDPYHLTKIAFEYQDPINQIMERKFSKNPRIIRAILKAIENTGDAAKGLNSKRTILGKVINNILGLYCLDIMKEPELIILIEKEIVKILKIDIFDDVIVEEE